MEQYKIIYIYILIIFIFLLSVLFYFHSKIWETKFSSPISCCYSFTILALITAVIWIIVDGNKKYISINYLLNIIEVSSVGWVGFFWFYYCLVKSPIKNPHKISLKLLYIVPIIISTFIIVTTPWTKKAFYINENGSYCRGPLFFVIYTGFIYVLVSSIIAIYSIKKSVLFIEKQNFKVISYLVIPSFGFGILQLIMSPGRLPYLEFAVYFLCFCMFVNDQNKSIRYDYLTKLMNKREFERKGQRRLKTYKKGNSKIYIFAGDLDGFKNINDYYGHNEGDIVLYTAARVLDEISIEYNALACRRSGDEFLLMISLDKISPDDLIKKINESLIEYNKMKSYNITMSLGYDIYDGKKTMNEMLNNADRRMYYYKSRNNFYVNHN